MERIVLVGGGGHALSVLDSLLSTAKFEVVGYTDQSGAAGDTLLGIPYLGNDEILPQLYGQGVRSACIAVGSIGNTELRVELYAKVKKIGFTLPIIIDPDAVVGRGCYIDEGVFIGKRAVINAGSSIGPMVIVNSQALVEHQCSLGAFSHIAPGAALGGNVEIGDHTHVGIGSTVIQGIQIGHHTLIGAGSVVIHNIGGSKKAYGNPCREAGEL